MAASRAGLILTAFTIIAVALMAGAAPGIGKEKGRPAKAAPATEPPMKVYVATSAQSGCEPNCPRWIAAHGQIVAGSLAQFKKALKQVGKSDVPVLIHSGGGLTEEGMAIGRLIRKRGLNVAVAKTAFVPCATGDAACRKQAAQASVKGLPDPSVSICASSCSFILAAGKGRFVSKSAFVGVHRGEVIMRRILYTYRKVPYQTGSGAIRYKTHLLSEKVVSQKRADTPEKFLKQYGDYFAEMGISKEIMPLLIATPNDGIHWLTGEELYSTGIATHRMSGEQLVTGAAVPNNGWLRPGPLLAPAMKLPQVQTGCTGTGSTCLSGDGKAGDPATPAMTDTALPSATAGDCARKGVGCSWDAKPATPTTPAR